jgi:hypothetical protein
LSIRSTKKSNAFIDITKTKRRFIAVCFDFCSNLWLFLILRERRALSDDEVPGIKIVRMEKKDDKEENNDNDDDEEEEDDDLQQYLKRKEARQ